MFPKYSTYNTHFDVAFLPTAKWSWIIKYIKHFYAVYEVTDNMLNVDLVMSVVQHPKS
jgi:hypothetical protein